MVSVIAIFDIGKTNKKLFLFNEDYEIVFEKTEQLNEIKDEDGFDCENVFALTDWIKKSFAEILCNDKFDIKAVNFSGYGASFVHVNEDGYPVAPLYNYLKPYPQNLQEKFYNNYGGKTFFLLATASPVLGNLNSGMQLYWLKNFHPVVFKKIKYSLHLPQFLSAIITNQFFSDITSIGCHTALWNFQLNKYHQWVLQEGVEEKLAPIFSSSAVINQKINSKNISVGIGLHDSSAALIPYLACFFEPFVLISTGTWCISLNPFNNEPLTKDELQQDCLFYMSYNGTPVKASRVFAGNQHEIETKRLAVHFNKPTDYFSEVQYNKKIIAMLATNYFNETKNNFAKINLSNFTDYETAYHCLMMDIIQQQVLSTQLIISDKNIKRIFVDGGFSKNNIYMTLLAQSFLQMNVFASSVAQASAVGAALAIHTHWNVKAYSINIINLKLYTNVR